MEQNLVKPFEWIISNRYRFLFHVLFWVIIYADELLSLFGVTPELSDYRFFFMEVAADMALVYFNFYVLIPQLLLKNKVWQYSILTVLTLTLNCIAMLYLYDYDEPATPFSANYLARAISIFLTTGSILGSAIGVKMFKNFIRNRQKVQELQSTNLQTELTFLKDQINPHFLFNALNNIYVQSRKSPEQVPESVLLLSDLLRYQLYDCSNDRVLLKDEIEYLKNYLKLDEMRKTNTKVSFEITGHANGVKVAPFIFLPFVENAVKYSSSISEKSFIDLKMDISEQDLKFSISNTFDNYENLHQGGIGQKNVQRRLELLYPNKHQLSISETTDLYTVLLLLKF